MSQLRSSSAATRKVGQDAEARQDQRPLRVLFDIVEGSQGWGGLEEHICVLGRHLGEAGHEPLFLRRGDLAADKLERLVAANFRLLEVPEIAITVNYQPGLLQWLPAYREVVCRERVDVVHLHSNLHGNELWSSLAARAAGRLAIVCTYHFRIGPESIQRRIAMWAMHNMLGVRGIAVSAEVENNVRTHYRPFTSRLVRIVNGVDDPQLYAPLDVGPPGSPVKVGVVCRLAPEKGVDTFLRAMARIDPALNVDVIIIGDGSERANLVRLAHQLGISDRVEFTGYVPDAARLLPQFDLVVIPSRAEGFPLLAVEACAAGRPIVATRAGGLAQLIQDGENGWLVEPDDVIGMTRAIEIAVREPTQRSRFGAAARRVFETELRAERMVERTLDVYQAALPRGQRIPN